MQCGCVMNISGGFLRVGLFVHTECMDVDAICVCTVWCVAWCVAQAYMQCCTCNVPHAFNKVILHVCVVYVAMNTLNCPGLSPTVQDSHWLSRIPTDCPEFPLTIQDSHSLSWDVPVDPSRARTRAENNTVVMSGCLGHSRTLVTRHPPGTNIPLLAQNH